MRPRRGERGRGGAGAWGETCSPLPHRAQLVVPCRARPTQTRRRMRPRSRPGRRHSLRRIWEKVGSAVVGRAPWYAAQFSGSWAPCLRPFTPSLHSFSSSPLAQGGSESLATSGLSGPSFTWDWTCVCGITKVSPEARTHTVMRANQGQGAPECVRTI